MKLDENVCRINLFLLSFLFFFHSFKKWEQIKCGDDVPKPILVPGLVLICSFQFVKAIMDAPDVVYECIL